MRLMRHIKLRTWIALGAISILLPVAVFRAIYSITAAPPVASTRWSFDEAQGSTAQDYSSNDNDGTITGANWTEKDRCLDGNCLFFDGTDDQVSRADDSDFDFAASDSFTISLWFRSPPRSSGTGVLAVKLENTGTDGGYIIQQESDGDITCAIEDDDADTTIDDSISSTAATYDDNKWHHVACVKSDTSSLTLYIDAIQVAQDTALDAAGTLANDEAFYLGADDGGLANEFSGFIDEFRLYRQALTVTEILVDFNFGAAERFADQPSDFLTEGLVGYWKLDHDNGNATDSSGNGLTLSNINATTFSSGRFANGSSHNGTNQYFRTVTTIAGVRTIAFWVNPANTTDDYINLASGVYINSSSGTVSAAGVSTPSIYVNGKLNGTLAAGTWNHVVVTTDSAISASSFEVGRANGAYLDNTGKLDEVRLYSRTLSDAEVRSLYNWAPGPVGWWKLDENTGATANDSSGNGLTGTLNNMDADAWVPGKLGSALTFDGTDDIVTVPDQEQLDLNADLTISVWIKPKVSSHSGRIVTKMQAANSDGYDIMLWNGAVNVMINNTFDWLSSVTVGAGELAHIAWTKSGTTSRIYKNGVLTETNTGTPTTINANTAQLHISSSNGGHRFNGLIDDVRVYNYARTTQQIIEDMNAGHPIGGSPVGTATSYWKFDEGYGTTAYDDIDPNSNDLTLSTASWTLPGKFDKAWNGTGARWLSRADDADFDVAATQDYSISLWFKSDSATNPTSSEYLFNKASATSAGYAVYANTSGNICFAIDDDATWTPNVESCSLTDIYDTNWHHILAVRNTTTDQLELYIDGKLSDSDSDTTAATLENTLTLYLGDRDGTDNGDELNGDLDEVKVFRSAVTADQAKILTNASSTAAFSTLSGPTQEEADAAGSAGSPPIVWLSFDENTGTSANDKSGNSRDATISYGGGGTFSWIKGKYGSATYFNGTDNDTGNDDYARARFSNDTFDSISEGTIEFWFKPDDTTEDDFQEMFFSGTSNSSSALEIAFKPSTNQVELWTNGCSPNIRGVANIPGTVTDWHHVAFVSSSSGGNKLYIDGLNVTISYTAGSSSAHCFLGSVATGTTLNSLACTSTSTNCYEPENYDGAIDEFKIYNYVRTPAQIAYDFNRGRPIAWYKMDDCMGTTINDLSTSADLGNALDGTWSGAGGSNTSAGTCSTVDTATAWYNGRNGKINNSLDFDGTDDIVTVTNGDAIDFDLGLRNSVTFAAWIYANSDGEGGVGQIFNKGTNTWCRTDTQGTTDLDLECSLDLATTDATLNITDALTTNTWHHVVMTYTDDADDEITIYIDGQNRGSSTNGDGSPAGTDTNNLLIGGPTAANFDGQIDDFRVFTYELSETQVRKVMNDGSAVRFGPKTGSP